MFDQPAAQVFEDERIFKSTEFDEGTCNVTWIVIRHDSTWEKARRYLCADLVNPDATHCVHEHDCCGHWYNQDLQFIGEMPPGFFHFKQYWWQNV